MRPAPTHPAGLRLRTLQLAGATALALAASLAAVLAGAPRAEAARLAKIGSFDSPVYATSAPGDPRRLFVVERHGTVRVVRRFKKLRRPFLRIPGRVSTNGERGLLSIAFHPGYQRNRLLYAFYTDGGGDLRVDEFKRARRNPNRALRRTRRHVIRVEHSERSNHNGGQLQFGPDGNLYISTGDGGTGGDAAQRRRSLLGKILRIDPRERGRKRYTVPRTNPFTSRRGHKAVFALGLRNPFRFSFDRATGALAIGDVGESAVEEIDFRTRRQPPGPNFGWNCFEGTQRYKGSCRLSYGSHVRPVIQRFHSQGNCSVIGGYVARHRSLGSLRGRYVYGDLCTGRLRSAKLRRGGARGDRRVRGINLPSFSLVSFGEGVGGRLYVISQNGGVFQLRN